MLTNVTCHIVENHSSFKKEQTRWKLFYKKYKPTFLLQYIDTGLKMSQTIW